MKKEIIKPFDLEEAKAGAKLRTKKGYPVEIFKWDARGNYPLKGVLIEVEDDKAASWKLDGSWCDNPHSFDLVIVEEVEEPEFWSDTTGAKLEGFFIGCSSNIHKTNSVLCCTSHNIFATEKQAKSALAMARISQIMANDIENFGGVITDEEWNNDEPKSIIYRYGSCIKTTSAIVNGYNFLAFHTAEQRDLFLEKYPQLVKDYLMIPDE